MKNILLTNRQVKLIENYIFNESMKEKINSPEFKKWFGKSKIVDEDGTPLIVSHSTINSFDTFDIKYFGRSDQGMYGTGFYFMNIPENYSYGHISMAIFLKIVNPFYTDTFNTKEEMADYLNISEDILVENDGGFKPVINYSQTFNSHVREKGHDGIVVKDGKNIQEIIAFEPNQIKSVKSTNFSKYDDNIYENIDIKNRIKQAEKETNTKPTESQIKAENYKKGKVNVNGFRIAIEQPKGSIRSGIDKDGKKWSIKMNNTYGYFLTTTNGLNPGEGKDGDAIDVFLGSKTDSKKIFAIDQFLNGEFDETKVFMLVDSKEEAKSEYLKNYEKGWKGFKYITEVDIETFKNWLYDKKRQYKPFAHYIGIKNNKINENIKFEKISKELKGISKKIYEERIYDKDYYLLTGILLPETTQRVKEYRIYQSLLYEGLIKTYPINKVINIIKNSGLINNNDIFYPSYESILDNIFDINSYYIQIFSNKGNIEKLNKLLNTCGYYNKKEKYRKNENDYILEYLPKYDVDVSKYIENTYEQLYHVSEKINAEKILRYGLCPKSKNKAGLHPENVYLSTNMNNIIQLFKDYRNKENFHNKYVLFSIDINKDAGYKYFFDQKMNNAVYTYDNISPQFITPINEFSINENKEYKRKLDEKNENYPQKSNITYDDIELIKNSTPYNIKDMGFIETEIGLKQLDGLNINGKEITNLSNSGLIGWTIDEYPNIPNTWRLDGIKRSTIIGNGITEKLYAAFVMLGYGNLISLYKDRTHNSIDKIWENLSRKYKDIGVDKTEIGDILFSKMQNLYTTESLEYHHVTNASPESDEYTIGKEIFKEGKIYNNIDDFIKNKNFNIKKKLGSGDDGIAYLLDNGMVLKYTKFSNEAALAQQLVGKKFKHIVSIYEVGQIKEKDKIKYYILMEYLPDINKSKNREFVKLFEKKVIEYFKIYNKSPKYYNNFDKLSFLLNDNFINFLKNDKSLNDDFWNTLFQLKNGIIEFINADIFPLLDFHGGNFGYDKNGILKFFDNYSAIKYNNSLDENKKVFITQKQLKLIENYEKNKINESYYDVPESNIPKIISDIKSKIKYKPVFNKNHPYYLKIKISRQDWGISIYFIIDKLNLEIRVSNHRIRNKKRVDKEIVYGLTDPYLVDLVAYDINTALSTIPKWKIYGSPKNNSNVKKTNENFIIESKQYNTTDELLKDINNDIIKSIGYGDDGEAWLLKNGDVLKITGDEHSAALAQQLKNKNYKHIVNVYDVGRIRDKFYIIQEFLNVNESKNKELFNNYMKLIDLYLRQNDVQEIENDDYMELSYISNSNFLQFVEKLKNDKEYLYIFNNDFIDFFNQLKDSINDINQLNNPILDFYASNFGYDKSGNLKLYDNSSHNEYDDNLNETNNKKIIFTKQQYKLMESYIKNEKNREVTYYEFISELKSFLKNLLINPISCVLNDFWKLRGFSKVKLVDYLISKDVLEKNESLNESDPENIQMDTSYNVLRKNFDRKCKRMWQKFEHLFNKSEYLEEDGEGAGATSIGGVGMDGGNTIIQPVFPIQRRNIYKPKLDEVSYDESTLKIGASSGINSEDINKNHEKKDINEIETKDVLTNMGWEEPEDPWKKKNLYHVDVTGLMGEEHKRKEFTDENGITWIEVPELGKEKYMIKCSDNVIENSITESRNKNYGGLEYLKKNQVKMTPEETKYFKDKNVMYWSGSGMKLIHKAKAKNEEDGEVFFSYTHRAWLVCPSTQKSKAVKNAEFIKTTS